MGIVITRGARNEIMETFSKLKVIGSPSELEKFIIQVEHNLKDGWRREKEREDKLRRSSKKDYQIFVCTKTKTRPAAALFFTMDSNKYLSVTNIVPQEQGIGSLGVEGYNTILEEFKEKIIDPAIKDLEVRDLEVRAILSPSEISPENSMSPELVKVFKAFSDAANKSGCHPSDTEMFFDFIIHAHAEKSLLDESDLKELLINEEWPEDYAHDLSMQYDFGRRLLERNDLMPREE